MRIRERDFERLRLVALSIEHGQSFELRLALFDFVTFIPELDDIRAIFEHDVERRDAEVAVAVRRELLRHDIERKRALVLVRARLRRKTAVDGRTLRAAAEHAQRTAEILMQQILAALDGEAIAEAVVLQMKDVVRFVKRNHDECSFLHGQMARNENAKCFVSFFTAYSSSTGAPQLSSPATPA